MAHSPHSSSPIYGNCQVYSPDDILMFRCDDKKANWYLKRNLAEIVSTDPLKIKLKFKPKGLGNHNKSYGLSEMSNRCVNCGTTEKLNKHHVVPHCYRRYFPLDLKSHNFHDVLPICVSCHESYERHADVLKETLAKNYNAPINPTNDKQLVKYVKIATTLLKDDLSKLPLSRISELRNNLKSAFNIKKLTDKKIGEISESRVSIDEKSHGEIVVSNMENIQDFIEMWRTHFINHNSCKFLPKNWNVKSITHKNENENI